MKTKLFILTSALFLLLTAPAAYSQGLVKLNRDKLHAQQESKHSVKKEPAKKQETKDSGKAKKNTAQSKKRKATSSRRRNSYEQNTASSGYSSRTATYLKVNDHYSNYTEKILSAQTYKSFFVNTDGSDYTVSMLPSWCRVTNRTSSYFTIIIDGNYSYDSRTDWFAVRSGNKEIRVSLNQEGRTITVAGTYLFANAMHNYYYNGIRYMVVTARVKICGGRGLKLYAVAAVQNKYGNLVQAKSYYSNYRGADGTFFATSLIEPTSDDGSYMVKVYIPNNAMMLYDKKNELTCKLFLYCEKKGAYIHTQEYSFPFTAKVKDGDVTTKQ